MAQKDNITLNISYIPSEEQFAGETCTACGDCIYGTGFRFVIAINTDRDVLPKFKESKIILCVACKEVMK